MATLKEQPNELQQKIYKLGYLDGKLRDFGKQAEMGDIWAYIGRGEPNKESHPLYWKGYDFGSDGNAEVDSRIFKKKWRAKNSTVYKPSEPTSMSHSEREKDYMAEKKNMKFTKKQLKQIIKEEASKYLDEAADNLEIIEEGPAVQELLKKLMTALGAVPAEKQAGLFAKLVSTVEKYAVASSTERNPATVATAPIATPIAEIDQKEDES